MMHSRPRARHLSLSLIAMLWLALVNVAAGQIDNVLIEVPPQQIGINGYVRPGEWTPLQVTLTNQSATPRQVRCQWLLDDYDRDQVAATRELSLTPGQPTRLWLYAPLPLDADVNASWLVTVEDVQTQRRLGQLTLSFDPNKFIPAASRAIATTGTRALGLDGYEQHATLHESTAVIRQLDPRRLPDRWFGLSMLQAIVWTPRGGNPDQRDISPANRQALRQWIRRGGHLIVVLPQGGQTWTQSQLADLLPDVQIQPRLDRLPPAFLSPMLPTDMRVNMLELEPRSPDVSVLLRDEQAPIVVTHRAGFGRVTLVGIDITEVAASRAARQISLPRGPTFWNPIFQWFGEPKSREQLEQMRQAGQLTAPVVGGERRPEAVVKLSLDDYRTAAGAVMLALLLFGVYWLAAGPVGHWVLKRKNATRYSWLGFAAVVLVITAAAWSGAMLLRPAKMRVKHMTVVDVDGNDRGVHVQSWMSMFVPHHGRSEVRLADPDNDLVPGTLANIGLDLGHDGGGFLDAQTYPIDAGHPMSAAFPMRATVRLLTAELAGPLTLGEQSQPWAMPFAREPLHIENRWPTGVLTHGLPAPLRDILAVYCPGDGRMPLVWRIDAWEPGQDLVLSQQAISAHTLLPLIDTPVNINDKDPRLRQWGGYLGVLAAKPGSAIVQAQPGQPPPTVLPGDTVKRLELLSFFDALPPPDYRDDRWGQAVWFQRGFARRLDLSALTVTHCLILIGHLRDSTLPIRLTIDGRTPPSQGWTVIRYIHTFD